MQGAQDPVEIPEVLTSATSSDEGELLQALTKLVPPDDIAAQLVRDALNDHPD